MAQGNTKKSAELRTYASRKRPSPFETLAGRGAGDESPTTTIHSLPSNVLLEVFDYYRLGKLTGPKRHSEPWRWYTLAHVCSRWRLILLDSPKRLQLQLLCRHGLPVPNILRYSPPLPLTLDYWQVKPPNAERSASGWNDESMNDALLALGHFDRALNVFLFGSPQRMIKFLSAMEEPPLELETLRLWSTHPGVSFESPLLGWEAPRLRALHLRSIIAPLPHAPCLTDLELFLHRHETPGMYTLNELIRYLGTTPLLEKLTITLSRNNILPINEDDFLSPENTRTSLPVLDTLLLRGPREHMEMVVSRVDAPLLQSLSIAVLEPFTVSIPSFSRFVSKAPMLKERSTVAHVEFSSQSVCIRTGTSLDPNHGAIWLSVSNVEEDLHLTSAITICGTLAPVLSSVNKLAFGFNDKGKKPADAGVADPGGWLALLMAFNRVTALRMESSLAHDVAGVLQRSLATQLLPQLDRLELLFHSEEDYLAAGIMKVYDVFLAARESDGRVVNAYSKIIPQRKWALRFKDHAF
ncbi:hypothetical protein BC834DRAFT_972379 [Gloeopeniophorella convolvens]|nr:hypothetical protein BC834DRAFT_972379 [Gloeopeniophorella convolvens]